jgi:predicted AAA+ superfamily ATPase
MASKLRPWRDIIAPHPDVASGRYVQAEFAADLAQVLQGRAEPEYQDPIEFYHRTYVTAGIKGLLRSALERLSGKGGEPVVQLKTSFGGGKTHSMLALYHLLLGNRQLLKLEPVRALLTEVGLDTIPKTACAVLVGTYLDPTKGQPKEELGGAEVRTLWGEMAFQLAGVKGYRLVDEADARGVAPGGNTLDELFNIAGPCVILIDELVAYVRNIGRSRGLAGGTFDSNMTFIQNLTEALKRAPHAVLVAAVPESNIEVGGPEGLQVLQRVEKTFERISITWTPAEAYESFEIVRRRLFAEATDEHACGATCSAFARLYRNNPSDFPPECREVEYERRMQASYPIHPEVFDRLYEDWSTLERFQRTRGVLRLMAAVIHQLWQAGDASPLIMAGSLPLYAPRVRDELLRYLNDQWTAVLNEVDGPDSEAARIDNENQRFGQLQAARRLTRAIFLGSVPYKATKGIEEVRLRLGVVQPNEPISTYNDALGRLQQRLQFLYTSGQGRYWFDVQPNLTRTVADRSSRVSDDEVFHHLEERLRKAIRSKGDFAGIHVCPEGTADVPDEPAARLVVLSPRYTRKRGADSSAALNQAMQILDSRGNSPRRYRNMLVFAAADEDTVQVLSDETRRYLAWVSIQKDAVALNLDRAQEQQVREAVDKGEKTIEAQLDAAYQWALSPHQEGTDQLEWEAILLKGNDLGSTGGLVQRASYRLQSQELLITNWSPIHLRLELDKYLWKDGRPHISVKQLWEYLATYLYLPRLRDKDVLLATIKAGVFTRDFFGYATGVNEKGEFIGLTFGRPAPGVYYDDVSVVIRPEIAGEQEKAQKGLETAGAAAGAATGAGKVTTLDDAGQPVKATKRFYGTIRLTPLRFTHEAGVIGQEIIQHLEALLGTDVEVTLEITAKNTQGFPSDVIRIVTENAKTLRFDNLSFEEE